MRRDIPPAVWKSPTIAMYKNRRTPDEIKEKTLKHPNMAEITHANTPAKTKTNLQDIHSGCRMRFSHVAISYFL